MAIEVNIPEWKAEGTMRTLWLHPSNAHVVQVLDQRLLPHQRVIVDISTHLEMAEAIRNMTVRGAPLIGVSAAFGMYLACIEALALPQDAQRDYLTKAHKTLAETRPTAINLFWALEKMRIRLETAAEGFAKVQMAMDAAMEIAMEDVNACYQIGQHGLGILQAYMPLVDEAGKNRPLQILTHCNAGYLGCLDWGTATSPIYQAHAMGIDVHVYVDETRPRNQGFNLTAYELQERGVPHTLIVDNTGGLLMQKGMIDLVIVGTDRVTSNGDVANKIGTYLKALAAYDNHIPFYVALPTSTIDRTLSDGLEIPIEERDPREVTHIDGWDEDNNKPSRVRLSHAEAQALNYGFDITPARYVTGFITERGVVPATEEGLLGV